MYGAAFGLVTPFHAPGSPAALKGTPCTIFQNDLSQHHQLLKEYLFLHSPYIEVATGVFTPAAPFSNLWSVPSNAIIFGSLLAVQRFGSKTAEFVRGKQDPWNDVFGCGVAYPYYQQFLVKHVKIHNRVVGGTVLLAIAYENLA